MDGTHDTNDFPPLAASVKSLPEAAEISLRDGATQDSLFIYARAVKAFEVTNKIKLSQNELQNAFSLWWNSAKQYLPSDADFDEYRFDFLSTFSKTRAPLGADPLEEATRLAGTQPLPPEAGRYSSPGLRQLVGVCYHLQRLQGTSPFFLSVRDAARIMGIKDLYRANAHLHGLVADGILIEIEKPKRGQRKATRFRYNSPEFNTSNLEPGPSNGSR